MSVSSAHVRGDVAEMKREAERLESDNPLWIVVFGDYSREFVAFPRFPVPQGTVVAARYPAAMPAKMRAVEGRALSRPAASTARAASSLPATATSAASGSQAVSVPELSEATSGDVAGR